MGGSIRERVGGDPYAASLGIELLDLEPGYCRAAMRLAPHMVNFHGAPHGGAIFSLADHAFSGACNAHGEAAVALSVTIQSWRRPGPARASWPRRASSARGGAPASTS